MTEEQIETILGDFRRWLIEHGDQSPMATDPLPLVNEFSALRHEVKLLTKATRGQSEQVAAALQAMSTHQPQSDGVSIADDPELRSVLMQVLEVEDTVDRAVIAVRRLADEPVPQRSLRQRLFAGPVAVDNRNKLAALADGLQLTQQRLSASLRRLELERVATVTEKFDPETMEALEAVACDQPTGTVLEEIRAGYCWRGRLFRYAQVKVAK